MLYLINCGIIKIIFDEEYEKLEMNYIVEAKNEKEAREKLQDYYSNPKYQVIINYVNEIIS